MNEPPARPPQANPSNRPRSQEPPAELRTPTQRGAGTGTAPLPLIGPPSPLLAVDQTGATGMAPVKISLWGPPGCGKTTYLAALGQAVTRADPSIGRWSIWPENERSEKQLVDWSRGLVSQQKFPARTDLSEIVELQWLFVGDLTGSRYEQRRLGRRRRKPGRSESKFLLDLVDVSGEAYAYSAQETPVVKKALEQLASADGLIYLFDPLTEREARHASEYLDSTLVRLRRQMRDRLVGGYLPQDVSVCVTKFDDVQLLFQARRMGLVNYGEDGTPRVLDEHAEKLFEALCKGDFWGDQDEESHASAAFVRDMLKHYFHPQRIRYYVTSSIGYWRPPGWNLEASERPGFEFNPNDFSNIYTDKDGERKIRGVIRPVNVLEPLISLQQRLADRVRPDD
jgi:hypothetical protein